MRQRKTALPLCPHTPTTPYDRALPLPPLWYTSPGVRAPGFILRFARISTPEAEKVVLHPSVLTGAAAAPPPSGPPPTTTPAVAAPVASKAAKPTTTAAASGKGPTAALPARSAAPTLPTTTPIQYRGAI